MSDKQPLCGHTHTHAHAHTHGGHGHSHGHGQDSCSDHVAYIAFWQYHWSLWLPLGLVSIILNPLIALYNWGRDKYTQYWVPFLFTFGEYAFGGQLNAGRVSRACKIIRIIATVIGLAAMLAVIISMGLESFQLSGGQLPLWSNQGVTMMVRAAWLALGCMAINMIAVFVGSSANHNKIQPYLNTRVRMQELKNRKNGRNDPVPHGKYDTPEMKKMNRIRYLHDLNGLMGTALSFVVFLSYTSVVFGGTLGIGYQALFILFIIRTLSSLLSVTFAPFTGHYRLTVHKHDIAHNMHDYVRADNNLRIKNTIDPLLSLIPESNEKQFLYFACYRACERYLAKRPDGNLDSHIILQAISPYIKKDRINMEYIKNRAAIRRVPQMDAFLFIENEITAHLLGTENKPIIRSIGGRPIANGVQEELLCRELRNEGVEEVSGLLSNHILVQDPLTFQWKVKKDCAGPYVVTPALHGQPSFEVALMDGDLLKKTVMVKGDHTPR